MKRKRFRFPSPLDKIRRDMNPPPGKGTRRVYTLHGVTGFDWFAYWLMPSKRFARRAARKVVRAHPPAVADIPLYLELPNGKRYQIFRVGADDVRVEETSW